MERLESIGSPVSATLMEGALRLAEGKTVVDAEAGCVWFIPSMRFVPDEPSPQRELTMVISPHRQFQIVLRAVQARHLWLFDIAKQEAG